MQSGRAADDVDAWKRAHARLLQLYEIGKALTQMESIERTIPQILAVVCATTPLRTAVLLVDDPHGRRRMRAILWHADDVSPAARDLARAHAMRAHSYLVGTALPTDVGEEIAGGLPLSVDAAPASERRASHGFVLLPLVVAHHRIFGALQVEAVVPLDEEGLMFIDAVVNHLAIALDRLAVVHARQADAEARQSAAEAAAVVARRAEQEQRFLSETSARLASAVDERIMQGEVVRTTVPFLGDVCILDVITDDGSVQRRAVAFADPEQAHTTERIQLLAPATTVLESGESRLVPRITESEGEELAGIGSQSMMIVPLVARGRTLGALTFVSTSSRRYGRDDLDLAEDLARRLALATDGIRLYDRAQRAVSMRQAILEMVSHDLKNPLGNILMSAATLQLALAREDKVASKSVGIIQRAASGMQRIVVDLLDLASIETGRLTVTKHPESIAALARDAVDAHETLAEQSGLSLELETIDESLEIECDRERVLQVLGNLIGNAIKFTPEGGAIVVRADAHGPDVVLSVSDSGPGISPDELIHVFERYWQTRKTAHLGTGLGLSIAKALVEAHGGRLWADSVLGYGATFFFTLAQPASQRRARPPGS